MSFKYFASFLSISDVVNMDAAMEELWKHFKLSDEEEGIMAVESHEVAISKQQAQFSILFTLQTTKDFNRGIQIHLYKSLAKLSGSNHKRGRTEFTFGNLWFRRTFAGDH